MAGNEDSVKLMQTYEAPGFVPDGMTAEQVWQMHEEAAMCFAEVGYPCKVIPARNDAGCSWEPQPPTEVVNRARFLVFQRWGLRGGDA